MTMLKKNLANIITISRVLISFVVAGILYSNLRTHDSLLSWIAFVLTIITMWFDGLDGFVARKFNLSSKFGSVLDIMGDRIVENVYWIVFAYMQMVPLAIPIIFIARGIIVDSLRSLAMEEGYTAFGEKTMMTNPVAKFIVASNFSRFTYAIVKALTFLLLIGAFIQGHSGVIYTIGIVCTYVATAFCILRGIPVIIESKRFFNK